VPLPPYCPRWTALGSCGAVVRVRRGAWRFVGGCCSSAAKPLQCIYGVLVACCLLPLMTTADRNDLVPSQKLEWVTPKISLMEAGDSQGLEGN